MKYSRRGAITAVCVVVFVATSIAIAYESAALAGLAGVVFGFLACLLIFWDELRLSTAREDTP